jgi:hypothetical protein
MSSKQLLVKVTDTALLLECVQCCSGWIVQPMIEGVSSWVSTSCPGCGLEASDARVNELLKTYRALTVLNQEGSPRVRLVVTITDSSS